MTLKDDVKKKTGEFLSNSLEMFDKIFAQATRELEIRRKPKHAVQGPTPAAASGTPHPNEEKPRVAKKTEKTAIPPKQADGTKPARAVKFKPKRRRKAGGGSSYLRMILLSVVLLVIAGFAANHFSIIDLSLVPDLLGFGPKPVVQAPIPRKQPAKPPQKPVVPAAQPQAQEKGPTAPPAPSLPTPPALSKEEKLVELETPTTVAESPSVKERIEEKAPPVAPQAQPSPPQASVKEEPQPVPVQAQVSEKSSTPKAAPSKPSTPQYPYSVYLGSFKAPDAVKKALSDYQGKGLSAYWVKVDLGDKGVWYRIFTGYFRSKEEAAKYISEKAIQGAEPGITKYANLIGIYTSEKEAEDQKMAVGSAGFYPYVIKDAEGSILVYSGACDRKEYAEKERDALAGNGIKSEVVER